MMVNHLIQLQQRLLLQALPLITILTVFCMQVLPYKGAKLISLMCRTLEKLIHLDLAQHQMAHLEAALPMMVRV